MCLGRSVTKVTHAGRRMGANLSFAVADHQLPVIAHQLTGISRAPVLFPAQEDFSASLSMQSSADRAMRGEAAGISARVAGGTGSSSTLLPHSMSAPNLYSDAHQLDMCLQLQQQEEFDLTSSLFEKQNPLLYNSVVGSRKQQRRKQRSSLSTHMSRSTSSPSLRQLGASNTDDLEVYVVLRNFQEFGNGIFYKLPAPLRDGLRDSGICHYMTVFKQKDGTLIQFDFGPSAGGDIHVSSPGPLAPLGRMLNMNKSPASSESDDGIESSPNAKKVDGQVRERRLRRLPDSHMYVGTTNMSLADIRAWNMVHAAPEYELHRSDCRHYTNSLVRYTTGIERAAVSALRHQLARKQDGRGRTTLGGHLIRLGQYFTDVANWDRLCAIGNATTAAILTLGGQQTLARVGGVPLLQSVGAYSAKLIPAGARTALLPVKTYSKALFQRPVYAMSTAAVATVATTSNEVATNVSRAAAPVVTLRNALQTSVKAYSGAVATIRDNVTRTQATASKAVSSVVEATYNMRRPGVLASRSMPAALSPSSGSSSSWVSSVPSSPQKKQSMFAFSRSSAGDTQALSLGPGRGITGAAIQQLALIATRR